MTPQLVDLNADGHQDMVVATFEGTAFLIEGSEEGWKKPQHIVDENDTNVRINLFYDMEENDYKNVDRSSDDYESVEGHHLTSIALADWDEDGDLDLILGAYEGALYRCENVGSATEPKFAANNHRVMAGEKHLTIKDGLATPRVVDWNGDGLFDLLCGGCQGGVYYFENTGTKGEPEFAASQTLIDTTLNKVSLEAPPEDATPSEMTAFLQQSHMNSMMVPTKDGLPACPGTSFHLDTVDYDGDGDLDILIGAQSYTKTELKKLTAEEQAELDKLDGEMAKIQAEISAFYDNVETQEQMSELTGSKEYREVAAKLSEVSQGISAIRPGPRPSNFIWLYRNNSTQSNSGDVSSEDR